MITPGHRIPASFRDPGGFVFVHDEQIYRFISRGYVEHYNRLMQSGLYAALVEEGLLVPHVEVAAVGDQPLPIDGKIIKPERVPFISYPYEWCFSQLKDAALLTLRIQRLALNHGMSLKDCSAYNVQFVGGKPVFIDTSSFEINPEGQPWVAYRQFCQHFLAPLSLMARVDIRLRRLMRTFLDGIPVDLASRVLPHRSWLSFPLLIHIHLHARAQVRHADAAPPSSPRRVAKQAVLALVESLAAGIERLQWRPEGTTWVDYYETSSYTDAAMAHKAELVGGYLDATKPSTAWDLGANTGVFSRLACARGVRTVAFDIDPGAVEVSYVRAKREGEPLLLPLLLDITNPSPALGWQHSERMSLTERGPADLALALALIHHIAIGNNVPFSLIAQFLADLCDTLVIEFVPKDDPQVQRLLRWREDIFDDYTVEAFEAAFAERFAICERSAIRDTSRVLYLMRRTPSAERVAAA